VRALAAEHLLPREGRDIDLRPVDVVRKHARRRIGEREALTVVRDPVRVRHAHAAGGPVPGEQHVIRPVDRAQIGQLAVIGAHDGRVDLELLHGIRDPALAEALPGERGDGLRAQHRPHRHLVCAGVGAGDDTDAVRIGELQQFAHQVDAVLEAGLADLRAMRATERFRGELVRGPTRRFRAGTGAEKGTCRLRSGQHRRTCSGCVGRIRQCISPHREHARRWDRVARRRP
jgi:hypothetical protein